MTWSFLPVSWNNKLYQLFYLGDGKYSWQRKIHGEKRAENTNNLLPIFYIKDLATNNDSVGDQVDKHSLIF